MLRRLNMATAMPSRSMETERLRRDICILQTR
jgi:hypothetical protein